jgi:branched-chain amino acid aminotransferase
MANSWLDGRLVEGKIPLDPSDRGLILGEGLFETIAVFNRNPAYLGAHLDRLADGAEQLGIEVSRASSRAAYSSFSPITACRTAS